MSPGIAFLVAEITPALAGAGIALVASSFIQRHHEKRLQWVEHEVAHLHALRDDKSFAPGSPGHIDRSPDPSTPEVSKRFKAMVA